MKKTVMPVVFGVLAIAIISFAWALPSPNVPEKAPPVVTPYAGTRPRITISWNIHTRVLPGKPQDAFR